VPSLGAAVVRRHRDDAKATQALVAFYEHDLDAIMSHFAEDCVFEGPARTRSLGLALGR
jgi:hypothetical protein